MFIIVGFERDPNPDPIIMFGHPDSNKVIEKERHSAIGHGFVTDPEKDIQLFWAWNRWNTHTWLSGRLNFRPNGSKVSFSCENSQSLAANPPTRKTDCNLSVSSFDSVSSAYRYDLLGGGLLISDCLNNTRKRWLEEGSYVWPRDESIPAMR